MSQLSVYAENNPSQPLSTTQDPLQIQQQLESAGVTFRQWPTLPNNSEHTADNAPDAILTFYHEAIARLKASEGYTTADIISLTPDNPQKEALRKKFLDEHTHSEDEVRFFVKGSGLFSLHLNNKVYSVHCEAGDLINVPANTPHWFDMGPNPSFTCIRLFTNPEGWVAHYTGSQIADQFPRFSA